VCLKTVLMLAPTLLAYRRRHILSHEVLLPVPS
jgi:hypothetical protein